MMKAPAKQLVRYSAMCTAIAAADKVDEVKSIRDKSMAIRLYARQAGNFEAERQAQNIRVRAERRAGELLATMPKAKGAAEPGTKRGSTRSPNATASTPLAALGVTKQQASEWQQLAKVPEKEFEKALADKDHMPSGRSIVKAGIHNAWVHESEKFRERGELVPSSPDEQRKFAKEHAAHVKNEQEWSIEQACFYAFIRSEAGKNLISRVTEVMPAGIKMMACEKANSMIAALTPWIEAHWPELPIPGVKELGKIFAIEAAKRRKLEQ
jgi:hypothetical protein